MDELISLFWPITVRTESLTRLCEISSAKWLWLIAQKRKSKEKAIHATEGILAVVSISSLDSYLILLLHLILPITAVTPIAFNIASF